MSNDFRAIANTLIRKRDILVEAADLPMTAGERFNAALVKARIPIEWRHSRSRTVRVAAKAFEDFAEHLTRKWPEHVEVLGSRRARRLNEAIVRLRVRGGETRRSAASSLIPDDASMSAADIAAAISAPTETVRKRLVRWRKQHDAGWHDVPNPRPNAAKVLYRYGDVKDEIADLAGTADLSAQRPAD